MKQKIDNILLHMLPHLVVKYAKLYLVKLPILATRRLDKSQQKHWFFWLHPPTSLEVYSFLYLLFNSVDEDDILF
jgi:hypothetical protein